MYPITVMGQEHSEIDNTISNYPDFLLALYTKTILYKGESQKLFAFDPF